VTGIVATLCAGLFAGAALYITIAEQPARLAIDTMQALAEFRPAFPRAAAMQASLALVGGLFAFAAWWSGSGRGWLVAALCLLGAVVFTLVAIRPVYDALLDPSLDTASHEARTLLERWGRLHAVRSVLGGIGFLACLFSVR
jgi:hypothetical protein